MIAWFLTIILHFNAGAHDQLWLPGETPYLSLDDCAAAGREMANYLTQDFTVVEWRCTGVPKLV